MFGLFFGLFVLNGSNDSVEKAGWRLRQTQTHHSARGIGDARFRQLAGNPFLPGGVLRAAVDRIRCDHPSNKECDMSGTQGGSHEQHVKAGQQSHKNADSQSKSEGEHTRGSVQEQQDKGEHTRGGSQEQHAKAGQQSHESTSTSHTGSEGEHTRGGTHEQHVKAGQQSHKNS
jgi:hypothetical protein